MESKKKTKKTQTPPLVTEDTNFEEMGIFELRELARAVGVHLPTTLRKAKLIEEIKAISSGKKERFVATHKKGRPAKEYGAITQTFPSIGALDNLLVAMDNRRTYDYMSWGKTENLYRMPAVELAQKLCESDEQDLEENFYAMHEQVEGIIHIDQQGNARMHIGPTFQIGENRIVKIGPRCIERYNLRSGDYIQGMAGLSKRDGRLTLFRVYTICGHDAELSRVEPFACQNLPITQQIDFDDETFAFTNLLCPIGKGQRVMLIANDDVSGSQLLKKFASELSTKMHTFYVVLDNPPENTMENSIQSLEYITCPYNLAKDKQLYIFELILDSAIRMMEYGHDVAILVEDIVLLNQMYKRYYSKYFNTKYEINECTETQMKQNISIAKNTDKGSITFFAGVSNPNNINSEYIINNKRSYNSLISIKSYSDYTPLVLDIANTYTINAQNILQNRYPTSMQLRANCLDKDNETINQIIHEYNNK